jgi:GNAT superfamily N-acetyltransferase
LEYFRAQLREHDAVVAVAGGQVAGFAIFGDGWLEHLYVDPSRQNAGIGAMLLSAVKSRSAALQLWTFQANTGARRFYERHGFVLLEETDGAGTEERLPDLRYQWRQHG